MRIDDCNARTRTGNGILRNNQRDNQGDE